MARAILCILLVCPALAAAAGPAGVGEVNMAEPVKHANAGISLAMPKGFEYRPTSSPFDVCSAAVLETGRATQAVTLSAFPLTEKVSAEEFAESKMAELSRNVAIRNLKTLRKMPMPVGGAAGAVRLVTYTFRGTPSVAAQVYFIRDIANTPNRICYLLTVVTTTQRQTMLLPVLSGVIRSVSLIPVKLPQVPTQFTLDEPVQDADLGFAVRMPQGWYLDRSGGGVEAGLINYLEGGIPMPSVKVTAAAVPPQSTSESCSKKYLALLQTAAIRNKQDTRLVSDANATLGSLPAWQFVLQLIEKPNPIPSLGGKTADDLVIINRTARLALPGKPPVAYTITLTAKAAEQAAAKKFMDALSVTFKALGPPTQPAGVAPTTGPTTQPVAPVVSPSVGGLAPPTTQPARP